MHNFQSDLTDISAKTKPLSKQHIAGISAMHKHSIENNSHGTLSKMHFLDFTLPDPEGLEPLPLLSKGVLNKMFFFGYFDPENIFSDNDK